MAECSKFSQAELQAIEAHPLNDGLHAFLKSFHLTPTAENVETVDQLVSQASDIGENDILLQFIMALQTQPPAQSIRSRIKSGALALGGDIALFFHRLSAGQEEFTHVAPLLRLVLTQTSDVEVWTAVLNLIANTTPLSLPRPTTPPPPLPSFSLPVSQTPNTHNSGSITDSIEHRHKVDNVLKEELRPTLRIDIHDFILAVFDHIPSLDELAEEVFHRCQEEEYRFYIPGRGWTGWPAKASEGHVLNWLTELMKYFIEWMIESNNAISRQIYQGPSTYLDGSTNKRKMDVGIMRHHENNDDGVDVKSDWTQILVAGELKSNPHEDNKEPAWLDLATYVREIFCAQDRRFVLGFTLCGSRMRLWHFDRSGSSGSYSFDINEEGLQFVKVMLGYFLMSDEQLGIDPTIEQSNGQRYMNITRNDQIEQLVLTQEIRKTPVIAGRATACWRAYRVQDPWKKPLLVKKSWQYEERPEEGELIKEATGKGVQNIAQYYHHETVQVDGKDDDTIENVRRGLMKTCGRTRFRHKSFNEDGTLARRGRSQSARPSSSSRNRSSGTAQMAPPVNIKGSCSSIKSRNSGLRNHNRVHRLVITENPGKNMYTASGPLALINGLKGAIKGHESSLNVGILHRDVSMGNIMLTEDEKDGFLIDYDLAIKTTNIGASGAPGKTGTKVFMAIGALRNETHSFMHDLESFFWVLFWVCIHFPSPDPTKKEEMKPRVHWEYDMWNYDITTRLADLKAAIVAEEPRFKVAMADFSPRCESLTPCMLELRKVMFPGGIRWQGQHRELYSNVIGVLDQASEGLSYGVVS